MKEVKRTISFTADLIDQNGEVHSVNVNEDVSEKYYSIKKLNQKVQYMDLIDAISEVTRSSKEVKMFGVLFSNLDSQNCLNINVSKFCRETGYARTTVSRILKDAIDCEFAIKIEKGKYFINPFIVRGTSFRSNKNFESVQKKWEELSSISGSN